MQDSPSENSDIPQVSIVEITPKISEEALFSYSLCYMGISLDNSVFYGESLKALLSWATRHFDRCLVIVGDHLRRFNEHIFNGLENEAAQKAAEQAGDSFIHKTSRVFEQFHEEKIHLTRWKEHLKTDMYKKAQASLHELFSTNSDFRASIQKDAFSFTRRLAKQNEKLAVDTEQAIELSCRYLLEEIAVFSVLSEQGWNVEVYPGPELHVLVDIAKGTYPNVPQGLKERVNVQLRVRGSQTD